MLSSISPKNALISPHVAQPYRATAAPPDSALDFTIEAPAIGSLDPPHTSPNGRASANRAAGNASKPTSKYTAAVEPITSPSPSRSDAISDHERCDEPARPPQTVHQPGRDASILRPDHVEKRCENV